MKINSVLVFYKRGQMLNLVGRVGSSLNSTQSLENKAELVDLPSESSFPVVDPAC